VRKSLEDVLRQLPINGDYAFTNLRGKFREKIKKKQLRILRDFVHVLKHCLEPDEEILLSMRGVSPFKILEQLTTGWWIFVIKRCVLVLTNKRILHFPATSKYGPRDSVSQIGFNDMEKFKAKRKITFWYKNGLKEVFYQVKNGRKFSSILTSMNIASSSPSLQRTRHHLCPKCLSVLKKDFYQCSKCRLDFKDPAAARMYSIFLPGGGYFYTRHPLLGFFDALVELPLLFFSLLYLAGYIMKRPGYEDGWLVAAVLGGLLIFEKLITIYHAGHFVAEYIPVEREFRRIARK